MKRLVVLSIGVLACAAAVPPVVVADDEVKSKISVKNTSPGTYEGKVRAKKKCNQFRKVEVWHDTNGNNQVDEDDDFKIGEATTDENGKYTVTGNQAPKGDRVIAFTKKENRGNKKCLGADDETDSQFNPGD